MLQASEDACNIFLLPSQHSSPVNQSQDRRLQTGALNYERTAKMPSPFEGVPLGSRLKSYVNFQLLRDIIFTKLQDDITFRPH